MIVLKHREKWSMVGFCQGMCHSRLEIEQEDIYVTMIKGDRIIFNYTFRCPCCNIESNIEETKLPRYVKISALEQLKVKFGLLNKREV